VRVFDSVVLHTKTGQSIRGTVRRQRGRWVVLSHAVLLDGQAEPVDLDGDVLVPRENVDFAQRTTKGEQR
jgi:hypothetical protein